MRQLQVDLRHGFDGELVILRIDGNEVYQSRAKTEASTGFADRLRFSVAPSKAQRLALEVEIPEKGVFGVCGFVADRNVTIQMSLESNGILAFVPD